MDNLLKIGLMLVVGLIALKVAGWLFSNVFAFVVGYLILKYWGKHKEAPHQESYEEK